MLLGRNRVVLFVFLAFLSTGALMAQPFNRTFVSAQVGSDLNNCMPTAPCRTFAKAMTNTAPNGEVIVLDSGGYGSFTITHGVQIQAPPGVYAGIASAGIGVMINAPGALVRLKGLTLNSTGGIFGIYSQAAATLYFDDLTISGFNNLGENDHTGGIYVAAGDLDLANCALRKNFQGLYVNNASATRVNVSVYRSAFEDNQHVGLWIDLGARAVATDSHFERSLYGVATNTPSVQLTLENCVAASNSLTGVYANGGSQIRISHSTIVNNNFYSTYAENGGTVLSRGNNTIEDNQYGENGPLGTYNPR